MCTLFKISNIRLILLAQTKIFPLLLSLITTNFDWDSMSWIQIVGVWYMIWNYRAIGTIGNVTHHAPNCSKTFVLPKSKKASLRTRTFFASSSYTYLKIEDAHQPQTVRSSVTRNRSRGTQNAISANQVTVRTQQNICQQRVNQHKNNNFETRHHFKIHSRL